MENRQNERRMGKERIWKEKKKDEGQLTGE